MNMVSVIVFSKDRPMQLHAYIESLLKFSDIQQNALTVLYKKTGNIQYDKVISQFNEVNWIEEYSFFDQLNNIIKTSNGMIMFGCDDVLFTGPFNFKDIENYLNCYESILGFSLRLGDNIIPKPVTKVCDKYQIWTWNGCKYRHYNYPWELDCTVYRSEDVKKILSYLSDIKNPNYLEAELSKCGKKIKRENLACYVGKSKAIVITVNRVQDDFCNPVDELLKMDIDSLNYMYNTKGNTLHIEKIAKKHNSVIHVGSEYFILRKITFAGVINRVFVKFRFLKKW